MSSYLPCKDSILRINQNLKSNVITEVIKKFDSHCIVSITRKNDQLKIMLTEYLLSEYYYGRLRLKSFDFVIELQRYIAYENNQISNLFQKQKIPFFHINSCELTSCETDEANSLGDNCVKPTQRSQWGRSGEGGKGDTNRLGLGYSGTVGARIRLRHEKGDPGTEVRQGQGTGKQDMTDKGKHRALDIKGYIFRYKF